MRRLELVLFGAAVLGIGCADDGGVGRSEWPMFGRTPFRNMAAPDAKNLPMSFDPGRLKPDGTVDLATTKDVLWVAKLGSQTYGYPTVSGGRVYVGTNNEGRGDSRFKGDYSLLKCLDSSTGKEVWTLTVPKLGTGKVGDWEYLGICSSPTVVGNRVYIVTNRCEVMCLDVNGLADGNQGLQDEGRYMGFVGATPGKPVEVKPTDADIVWRYDMAAELGVFPHNVTSSSILAVGDIFYCSTSNGVTYDHTDLPSPKAPAFIALNRKIAERPGATPREILVGEEGSGLSSRILHAIWTSPSWGEANGRGILLFGGPDGFMYAFDPNPVKDADCLDSATGFILWRKSYNEDFGGRKPPWAFGDSPIVDGKLVVCAPGGNQGTLAALDKANGAPVWRSAELKETVNATVVPCEIGGVRQYVVLTYASVAGISAKAGKLLWRAERVGKTAVVTAPIVHDGIVFVTSSFGVGCNAFRVTSAGGAFKAEEIYRGRQLENQHGGVVRLGDHLYGTDNSSLKCVELKTGNEIWTNRCVGKGSVTTADGLVICRSERGPVALVEATPEGYRERGKFNQPDRTPDPAHTRPVVAGGRLYLRDQDALFCYDLRSPDFKTPAPVWNIISRLTVKGVPAAPSLPPAEGKAPDAAFVPTPKDVVEKMLDLARVTKEDVVYDLGSGDGRILIAAAERYGCRAVGYEIHPELVKLSRARAKEAKVEAWVTVEEKDLFTADLSRATVVTLYLGEPNNRRLLPQLRQLKDEARIVSHAHLLGLPELKPEKSVTMTSKENGSEHTIHLWTAPLGK